MKIFFPHMSLYPNFGRYYIKIKDIGAKNAMHRGGIIFENCLTTVRQFKPLCLTNGVYTVGQLYTGVRHLLDKGCIQ
jgi:hypothetical protein